MAYRSAIYSRHAELVQAPSKGLQTSLVSGTAVQLPDLGSRDARQYVHSNVSGSDELGRRI
jgi:hypothetical protein